MPTAYEIVEVTPQVDLSLGSLVPWICWLRAGEMHGDEVVLRYKMGTAVPRILGKVHRRMSSDMQLILFLFLKNCLSDHGLY